ncbi:MAG TPA: anti-sigma factor, partial [Planctomycetota bacterium]|nr:anti-sigma factor [Planctomycetota bacterium]
APVFTRLFWAAAAVALFSMIFVSLRHAPEMRELSWNPTSDAPAAHGSMRCWGPSVVFTVSGLPQLPGGKVYQLWHIGSDKVPIEQATFTPTPSGELVGSDRIKHKIAAGDLFGITMEPAGGSRQPTMPIFAVAKY